MGYSGGVNLYGYVGNGVERGIDPSGKIVKFCWRPTIGIDRQPESHWFLYDSKCGCLGYGPQGVMIEKKNNCQENKNGYTPGHGLHCRILPATPQQEFCLCQKAKFAQGGRFLGGVKWSPGIGLFPPKYTLGHVCQDFVSDLLGECDPEAFKNFPLPTF
jgi:hypothetical protein